MTGLGGLLLLAWFDFGMLAALLVCCVVAGQGLERRGLFWLRLAAAVLAECLWAGMCTYQWILTANPLLGDRKSVV